MKDPQTGATRQPNPVLIFDGGTQLPVQFRDTMSVYATEPFSLEGLSTLNTSGSHQYDETQLQNIITRVDPNDFVIHFVDLRQESHVFINGIPVSWYADDDWANVGRSLAWIEEDETLHLLRMIAARSITVGTVVKGKDGQVSMKDPVQRPAVSYRSEPCVDRQRDSRVPTVALDRLDSRVLGGAAARNQFPTIKCVNPDTCASKRA